MASYNDHLETGNSILGDIYNACARPDSKGPFNEAACAAPNKEWLNLINDGIETPKIT